MTDLGGAENAFSERLLLPRVVECDRPENAAYAPVVPIAITEARKARFRVVGPHHELDVTPAFLAQAWIPDNLLEAIEAKRNDYAMARLAGAPKKRQREVQAFEI